MNNRFIPTYQKECLLGIRFRIVLYGAVLLIGGIFFYLLRSDMLWNGFSLMAIAGSIFLLIEAVRELFYFRTYKQHLQEHSEKEYPIQQEIARLNIKLEVDKKSRKVNQSIFLISLLFLPGLLFFYKDLFLLGILIAILILSAIAQVFDMLENHSDREYLYHLGKQENLG